MKKIKLWTIQNETGWNALNNTGVLVPKVAFIDPDFKEGYDWMRIQMNKRIGKSIKKEQYPVWAWYQHYDANKKKPDLRKSGYLPPGEVGYRLEIEKDPKDILLSDFVLWHWPLCYKEYIADSEKEAERINLIEPSKEKIEKSWEKIFDMNFDEKYYTLPFKEKRFKPLFGN